MMGSGLEYLMWQIYLARLREAEQDRLAWIARGGKMRRPGPVARAWAAYKLSVRPGRRMMRRAASSEKRTTSESGQVAT